MKMIKKTGFSLALLMLLLPLRAALPLQTQNLASPAYWGLAHSGGALEEIRNAYWLNPALNSYEDKYIINLNEAFLPGSGIFISELSGHYRIPKAGLLQSGINYENYGNFESRDAEGILLGNFTAAQYQYFIGYADELSEHFSVGLQLVYLANRIDASRETYTFLRYGIRYRFGARDNVLALSGITDGMANSWRASFSHELEYLPLRLNLDYRWYGDDGGFAQFRVSEENGFDFGAAALYFAEKFSIAALISPGKNLHIMAGIDLSRLNMRTSAFGLDTMLSGVALGGKYRLKQLEFSLGIYHYANFSSMTALGITYIGK